MNTARFVLAHQGGWDEILLVLTPVSLFAGLLWLANRRANAQAASSEPKPPPDPESPPDQADQPDDPTT